MNVSRAKLLAVAYLPSTRHCTVAFCKSDAAGIEVVSAPGLASLRSVTVTLRMENSSPIQRGGAVAGDSQNALYCYFESEKMAQDKEMGRILPRSEI